MGEDYEIFSENRKTDAGGDDKLWIQFVPPKGLVCQDKTWWNQLAHADLPHSLPHGDMSSTLNFYDVIMQELDHKDQ